MNFRTFDFAVFNIRLGVTICIHLVLVAIQCRVRTRYAFLNKVKREHQSLNRFFLDVVLGCIMCSFISLLSF